MTAAKKSAPRERSGESLHPWTRYNDVEDFSLTPEAPVVVNTSRQIVVGTRNEVFDLCIRDLPRDDRRFVGKWYDFGPWRPTLSAFLLRPDPEDSMHMRVAGVLFTRPAFKAYGRAYPETAALVMRDRQMRDRRGRADIDPETLPSRHAILLSEADPVLHTVRVKDPATGLNDMRISMAGNGNYIVERTALDTDDQQINGDPRNQMIVRCFTPDNAAELYAAWQQEAAAVPDESTAQRIGYSALSF